MYVCIQVYITVCTVWTFAHHASPHADYILDVRRFGQPLVLRVRRNLTQAQFQSVVLNAMKEQLKVQPKDFMEVCVPSLSHTQAGVMYPVYIA